MRVGPITGIVRLAETRHDLKNVVFATIDGELYYETVSNAQLGDRLELWKEGDTTRPIAAHLRWVLQQSAGYMRGSRDGIAREGVAARTEAEETRGASDMEYEAEHEAWLAFLEEFKQAAGVTSDDINDVTGVWDPVFIKLRVWGEKLALLRRSQPRILQLDERGYPSRRPA